MPGDHVLQDWITAARTGDTAGIHKLLAEGVDPYTIDSRGATAMHLASWGGHAPVIHALLQAGVSDQVKSPGGVLPIHVAANVPVVEALLQIEGNLDVRDAHGRTPLHHASYRGADGIVRFLIAKGADVKSVAEKDQTPLHPARTSQTVQHLVAAGAVVNSPDATGRTPLHWACAHGHAEVVAALIKAGADIHHRAAEGEMPIHVAVSNWIAITLLRAGAAPTALDGFGRTPGQWAERFGLPGLRELLEVRTHSAELITKFVAALTRACRSNGGYELAVFDVQDGLDIAVSLVQMRGDKGPDAQQNVAARRRLREMTAPYIAAKTNGILQIKPSLFCLVLLIKRIQTVIAAAGMIVCAPDMEAAEAVFQKIQSEVYRDNGET